MNKTNTTTTYEDLILRLGNEQFRLMIPALIYIVVLMVFGFVGNSMVFYYYWCKARVTTYSIFITLLSVYDLMVCVLAMPMEISRIVHFYTFENVTVCKLLRFSNYFASIGSILTLIAIASDRYRRICRWSATQMSIRLAKICCVMITPMSLLLSWPALVLYGAQEISIPNEFGVELKGLFCTGTWEESYKPYVSAFYAFMFALLVISTVVLTVLYGIIGRKIYVHKKKVARRKGSTVAPPRQLKQAMNDNSVEVFAIEESTRSRSKDATRATTSATGSDEKGRLTLMLVTITVLFLISYVPLFAMLIWRMKVGKHQVQFLSGAGLVAFDIATTSFLISSAVNPWVYGILCSDFRQYFIKRLPKFSGRSLSTSLNSPSNTQN